MPRIVPAIPLSNNISMPWNVSRRFTGRPRVRIGGLGRLWGHGCYERKADRRPSPSVR